MPWSTPILKQVRSLVRDAVAANLPGADANVPNSVLRVLSDAMGALCHLALQYIDWLALQLLPDTAETVWLDRHGNIWLTNSDGSTGRKLATVATGTADFVTSAGSVAIPTGTLLSYATNVVYQTTADILTDPSGVPTPAPITAETPGSIGNLDPGTALAVLSPLIGSVDSVTVDTLTGGTDDETDDELRARVLKRIREPPMGGDATDYEQWALAVPGVTRAWCAPMEMGIGTTSVRFMMDDLRASNGGFPLQQDIDAVSAYLDTVRPVTVKECYVLAPLKQPIDFDIANLNSDTPAVRAAIEQAILDMLFQSATPGQTIFAAWKFAAVMGAAGVVSFDMTTVEDDVMPDNGHMATLGDIYYSTTPVPPPVSQQSIAYSSHG
jgi:uncharacterized phage protein gp47/JayE